MSETGGAFHALADRAAIWPGRCPRGTVADGCVTCPLARQRLPAARTAGTFRGPATAPQPAFDTRVVDGHVEISLRREDEADGPGE
ncbi:Rieske domain-containing protein OS=Streptomyces fumanus OX=67302 GN=GCM10018772_11340 PE=4 SV=1 [Streptomyces fumanus]